MEAFSENWLRLGGAVGVLVALAWVADWLTVHVIRRAIRRVARRTTATWDDRIIERRVLARIAHVVPAVFVFYGIGPALGLSSPEVAAGVGALASAAGLVQRLALSFVVLAIATALAGFLDAINDIYNESYPESNNRPIKGYLQVVSLIGYLAAGVVIVSILADRSPIVFLSGLGAVTAILLLIFRDTILSLVASVQLMSNDMIRIGDWVEMPQMNADGDVIDIALHTVKVQNWDKTISTIPTHKFISESFKNWRGMSESGGRRIKRALNIDMSTIHFLSDVQIEELTRHELLGNYMAEKREQLAQTRARLDNLDPHVIPERRGLTNIGTFRAYVVRYLKAHPQVHKQMTLLVRQLEPGPKGLPIQIYCFSKDTAWATYEALQADIFDHLIAILPEFGLRAFQEPTGSDLGRLGAFDSAPN